MMVRTTTLEEKSEGIINRNDEDVAQQDIAADTTNPKHQRIFCFIMFKIK